MLHRTLLSSSKFSKMLDLGGSKATGGSRSAVANVLADSIGKNNKVAGVVFDFEAVTGGVGGAPPKPPPAAVPARAAPARDPYSLPDRVAEMAEMLGMELKDGRVARKGGSAAAAGDDGEWDDLSALSGGSGASERSRAVAATIAAANKPPSSSSSSSSSSSPTSFCPASERDALFSAASLKSSNPDVAFAAKEGEAMARLEAEDPRVKYASLLHKKGVGLAGIEMKRAEQEERGKPNDASFHVNIREALKKAEANDTLKGSAWLVSPGMGSTLSYMSTRALKIGIVTAGDKNLGGIEVLGKQLSNVRFHHLQAKWCATEGIDQMLADACGSLKTPAERLLVVSSHEPTLTAARDSGMFTCRLVVPNARRGVTTNWDVKGVEEVVDVVNEINGISFKSVRSLSDAQINYK